MRTPLWKLLGLAAFVGLMVFCGACVVAVREGPARRVDMPPPPPPPPPAVPDAAADDDFGAFYDGLAPYGEWFWQDPYGWVWDPSTVDPAWRPYTVGHWIYTDDGWFWKSDEPWGWATCHYGRWFFDSDRGWVWVPGHEWAPAWVAWRHGDSWVGWAPLPPRAVFRAGIGLDLGGVDLDVIIQPFWWGFVEERDILDPRIGVRIAPVARNVTLARVTRNETNYAVVRNRVVVRGIDVAEIERESHRRVAPVKIVDEGAPGKDRHSKWVGQDLHVFRPAMKDPPPSRAPRGAVRNEGGSPGRAAPDLAVGTPQTPPRRPEEPQREQRAARPGPPPRAAAETPAAVPEQVLRRQQAEARELERRHAAERSALGRRHQTEAKSAPASAPPEELKKRQDDERRAMDEQTKREKLLLEKRQER